MIKQNLWGPGVTENHPFLQTCFIEVRCLEKEHAGRRLDGQPGEHGRPMKHFFLPICKCAKTYWKKQ